MDFSCIDRQDGDLEPYWFSHFERPAHPEQRSCYLTWTTEKLREIIEGHLSESALYGSAMSSLARATALRSKTRS